MHTVELLEQALDAAARLGYAVRQESMAGSGGACVLKGRKIIFLDLDLDPAGQLEQVADALRREPDVVAIALPSELGDLLRVRRSA